MQRGINTDSKYFDEFDLFCKKLRKKILQLRKANGLTQEQMEEFELTLRQYQRIETGETINPTLSNLFKIAKALNISIAQLVDFK